MAVAHFIGWIENLIQLDIPQPTLTQKLFRTQVWFGPNKNKNMARNVTWN